MDSIIDMPNHLHSKFVHINFLLLKNEVEFRGKCLKLYSVSPTNLVDITSYHINEAGKNIATINEECISQCLWPFTVRNIS